MFAKFLSASACILAATGTSGCGNTTPKTSTTEEPTTATTEETVIDPNTEAPPQPKPSQQWTMPDLVGTDLQKAQDQIQALTGIAVFYTSSHDLSGQNRNQVLDANWKVCSQNVAPGTPIADNAEIDFGVMKLAESCP